MKNTDHYADVAREWARRAHEIESRFGRYRSTAKQYSVGPMPVVVDYTAVVGRVEFFKRGEEHIFIQTKTIPDRSGERWEEVCESAYSIRDEFLKVKTVGEAIEFLQKTGEFSPLRPRLAWTEFQKWQRFAWLVQEHSELAASMQSNEWSGDYAEALKALTGIYPSSFFDGCENALYLNEKPINSPAADLRRLEKLSRKSRDATNHEEWLNAYEREKEELMDQHASEWYEQDKEQRLRDLYKWFIKPPVTIAWQPIDEDAAQKIIKHHVDPATGLAIPIAEESPIMRGGALIEFLLPQDQLAPVLLIQPRYTLQAIAAAIYSERIQGITYRKCVWTKCTELFRIGSHKNKLYCDPPKPCKGNAQKKRQREKQRKEKEKALAASKSKKRTARSAGRH